MRTASAGGSVPSIEEAANVRVRRRVDVDRERGQRIVADAVKPVLVNLVVGLGVELGRGRQRRPTAGQPTDRACDPNRSARRRRWCGRHAPDHAACYPRWGVRGHLLLHPVGLGPHRPHQGEAHGRCRPVPDDLDAHQQRLKSRHEGTDLVDAGHDSLEAKAAVGARDRRPLDARADPKVDGRTGDRSPRVVHDDARQDAGGGGIGDLQGTDGDQADGHETDKKRGQDQTHGATSARRRRLPPRKQCPSGRMGSLLSRGLDTATPRMAGSGVRCAWNGGGGISCRRPACQPRGCKNAPAADGSRLRSDADVRSRPTISSLGRTSPNIR